MQKEILGLFAARKGHFRFESGHHGDLWLDVPLAFVEPARIRPYAQKLAARLSSHRIEIVCGPLVEGAFLAQMVAEELAAEFCFAEQFARSTGEGLFPVGYRIPDALRARIAGKRVAVVDDVINAGSAVRGACEDLKSCGAQLVSIGALLTLGDRASALAVTEKVTLETLSNLEVSNLWEPVSCLLCAAGLRLEGGRPPR
jgi:orotate phosphoribosyltransferase